MAKKPGRLTTADDIKYLGTILAVWAHPDDESFLCAGLLATAVRNGQTVACITATKGEAGVQNAAKWPPATLGKMRAAELKQALKILGIGKHHWLGYLDGHCAEVPLNEGADQVLKYIKRYQPDTIITFGPQGLTGHTDHISMCRWVQAAVKSLSSPPIVYQATDTTEQYQKYMKQLDEKLDYYFNIDSPPLVDASSCDICFKLPSDLCRLKCRALAAQQSQTEALFKLFDDDFLQGAMSVEAFVKAK